MKLYVVLTIRQTLPEPIVRPSLCVGPTGIAFLAGDTNDNAVYLTAFDTATGRPLWNILLDRASNSLATAPRCSRCYLPRVAALPDGGALVSWKRGVKEVVHNELEFPKSDWGLMIARVNEAGKILWKTPYKIHKGNGQVVFDPFTPDVCQLIATDGIRWEIATADGAVRRKLPQIFPAKSSGEKVFSWLAPRPGKPGVLHSMTSGWSGCDSLYWNSQAGATFTWAEYGAYRDMGGDMIYVSGVSPAGKPARALLMAPYGRKLRTNEFRPGKGMLRGRRALRDLGAFAAPDRFAPQACASPFDPQSILMLRGNKLWNADDLLFTMPTNGWMTLAAGPADRAFVADVTKNTATLYGMEAQ